MSDLPQAIVEALEYINPGCDEPPLSPPVPPPSNILSHPPTEFRRFPSTSAEIQLKIWGHVESEPRIIRWDEQGPAAITDAHDNYRVPGDTMTTIESRIADFRTYEALTIPPDLKGLIYFDHGQDALYLPNKSAVHDLLNGSVYKDEILITAPPVIPN
jgi:hypothetical protein